MGWMRTLFLGDIGNHLDIADNRRDLDSVRSELRSSSYHQSAIDAQQSEQIGALQAEIEDLQMTLAALCRLLIARGVLAEADVASIVERLDT